MKIDISERAGKVIAILVFGIVMTTYLFHLGSYEKLQECQIAHNKVLDQCYGSVRHCIIYKRAMEAAGHTVPFNISYPENISSYVNGEGLEEISNGKKQE